MQWNPLFNLQPLQIELLIHSELLVLAINRKTVHVLLNLISHLPNRSLHLEARVSRLVTGSKMNLHMMYSIMNRYLL